MSTIAPPQVEYGADEISALVLDPGYSVVRAGFAGEDAPKSITPTHYGRKPNSDGPLFGENAVHNPFSGLDIRNPVSEDGIVEDWDIASKLWEYTITSRLTGQKQTSPLRNGLNDGPKEGENGDVQMEDIEQNEKPMSENPLIVTEPGWNPTKSREKTIEIAMEEWDVPAFFLARSGVMAAFASGKPTALVIDIGASNTAVTPVYDGLMLKKGMLHSQIAGNFVSDQIRLLFSQTTPPTPLTPHYLVTSKTTVDAAQPAQAVYQTFPNPQPTASFRRLQEERVLSEFKESVVHVWEPARMNGQSLAQAPDHLRQSEPGRPFEMPDGWNNVFGLEQYKAAEGLFDDKAALSGDPGLGRAMPMPTEKTTITGLCKAALAAVDTDSKGHLLNNVVVVGGTSLLAGLNPRLNHELTNHWPSLKVRLQSPGNIVERKYASWIGGSILASLGTFHQMWISKKEYEESGTSIVEKRCK